jgi:hypothetical protein
LREGLISILFSSRTDTSLLVSSEHHQQKKI